MMREIGANSNQLLFVTEEKRGILVFTQRLLDGIMHNVGKTIEIGSDEKTRKCPIKPSYDVKIGFY